MKEFEKIVERYFEGYSEAFLRALKEVQVLTPPEWAKSGCFWLQHDFRFNQSLPLCLTWTDGDAGHQPEENDPIKKVKTDPWNLFDSPDFPEDDDDIEDQVDLTICHWVRACWIQAGGRSHPFPFHIHHYATNGEFSLRLGRFIFAAGVRRRDQTLGKFLRVGRWVSRC